MHDEAVHELLYQALETELAGVRIYEAALRCVQNEELREEWETYHAQTQRHVELATGVLEAFGLDPGKRTAGREVVNHIGSSLVEAMRKRARFSRASSSARRVPMVPTSSVATGWR